MTTDAVAVLEAELVRRGLDEPPTHGASWSSWERGYREGIMFAIQHPAPAPLREALDVERLVVALREIMDITKPLSMTMSGPRWMTGDSDVFGGGNREKIWRIADAAIGGEEGR